MNYRIITLTLKRKAEIICNILHETTKAYHIHVYSVKNGMKQGEWKNGDVVTIAKELVENN